MRKSVMAIAAIGCLVLAAGAGAASRFIITSVHQIKPSVLRQLHGAEGATGARGPAGQAGAPGAPGAPGTFSTSNVTTVTGPIVTMGVSGSGTEVQSSLAMCPAGSVVLGGGYNGGSNPPTNATAGFDQPLGGIDYEVILVNHSTTQTPSFNSVAVCASGTGHVAHGLSHTQLEAIVARQVARLKR
jgi:hypothetical protein